MAASTTSRALHLDPVRASTTSTRVGWGVSALVIIFLLLDGVMKLLRMDVSVDATIELGYPESQVPWIGLALLVSTALYAIPRTALVGAILVTGFLGGAIATQVRDEQASFLFPALLGLLVWVGLALRDQQTRTIFR